MAKKKKKKNSSSDAGVERRWSIHRAMPHEAVSVKSLMLELFREIKDEDCVREIDGFVRELYSAMIRSPYNQLYIAGYEPPPVPHDEKKVQEILLGYIWIEMDTGLDGKPIGWIKQIYSKPGRTRNTVFAELVRMYLYYTKRNMIELHRVEAPNWELQTMWGKLGYKPVRTLLEQKGKLADILDKNRLLSFLNERGEQHGE